MTRRLLALALGLASIGAPPPAEAAVENGGSGLIRIGQAYSLPTGHPLISIHARYFTSAAAGHDRLFSLTPSATFGLGSGFEAAGALPLQGATLALEDGSYSRRFDLRRGDLSAKIRWTGPLRTTRFRIGAEGLVAAPLGDRTRDGGDRSPGASFDPGITGLVSTNIGRLDFPVRVHLNGGWWWSRNDGSFHYPGFPSAVTVPNPEDAGNDVGWAGIGVEAGLRRATVLVELVTEQFPQARRQIRARENLWTLTAGFQSALTATVGLTAAIGFDLSADDPSTAFDPDDVFPDSELRVALTLGSVQSREQYEARKRAEAADRRRKAATSPAATRGTAPMVADSAPGSPASPVHAPGAPGDVDPIAVLEQRVRDLETRVRLESVETRLRLLEMGRDGIAPAPLAPAPATAPSGPAAASDGDVSAVETRETSLARRIDALKPTSPESPPIATDPGEAEPVATEPAEAEPVVAEPSSAAVPPAAEPVAVAPKAPTAPVAVTAAPTPAAAPPAQGTATPSPTEPPAQAAPVAVSPAPAGSRTLTVVERGQPSAPAATWLPAASVASPASPAPAADGAAPADADATEVPLARLLQEYEARMATPLPERATAAASPVEPGEAAAPAEPTEAPPAATSFPLAIGARKTLTEIDLSAANPLAPPDARQALDELARALAADPGVSIAVTVYTTGGDRERALTATEGQAAAVRDYLVVAGAAPGQIRPLGMGADTEGGSARVEIERLR